jgi:DNA-binding NarL/FixJ family response regulator
MGPQGRKLRVVLADDHAVFLEGLAAVLGREPDLEIVGTTRAGTGVLDLVGRAAPDVLVLDLNLPDLPGQRIARLVRERYPEVAIVILTGAEGPSRAGVLAHLGVRGYLSKEATAAEVAAAIRVVAAGYAVQSAEAAPAHPLALTGRERQILAAVRRGRSNQQIAGELELSLRTVEWHVSNLLAKFAVASRAELIVAAARDGLPEGLDREPAR